jgi:hypothetical protein
MTAAWLEFQRDAQDYFSGVWQTPLRERKINLSGQIPRSFDLVSTDGRIVGDAKWLKNLRSPSAKLSSIGECIWHLQHVHAYRPFMVFGQDAEVAERYLARFRNISEPVEFYFLAGSGHRRI